MPSDRQRQSFTFQTSDIKYKISPHENFVFDQLGQITWQTAYQTFCPVQNFKEQIWKDQFEWHWNFQMTPLSFMSCWIFILFESGWHCVFIQPPTDLSLAGISSVIFLMDHKKFWQNSQTTQQRFWPGARNFVQTCQWVLRWSLLGDDARTMILLIPNLSSQQL